MRVGLCLTKDTQRNRHLLSSFGEGVRRAGDSAILLASLDQIRSSLPRCDVAVQSCFYNKKHEDGKIGQTRKAVIDVSKQCAIRVVTIDTGFVFNQSQLEAEIDDKADKHVAIWDRIGQYKKQLDETYYEVGFGGLKRYGVYHNAYSPADRWEALARRGAKIHPWREERKGYILLLGQTPGGVSSQETDIYMWYLSSIVKIRKVTSRPVVVRTHPRIRKRQWRIPKDAKNLRRALGASAFTVSKKWRIEEDLAGASVALVYSSNASVSAPLCGVPTFCDCPCAMGYDVCNNDFRMVETPVYPSRGPWVCDLAYAQWNIREMRSGECWDHLRRHATDITGGPEGMWNYGQAPA